MFPSPDILAGGICRGGGTVGGAGGGNHPGLGVHMDFPWADPQLWGVFLSQTPKLLFRLHFQLSLLSQGFSNATHGRDRQQKI